MRSDGRGSACQATLCGAKMFNLHGVFQRVRNMSSRRIWSRTRIFVITVQHWFVFFLGAMTRICISKGYRVIWSKLIPTCCVNVVFCVLISGCWMAYVTSDPVFVVVLPRQSLCRLYVLLCLGPASKKWLSLNKIKKM